MGDAGMRAEGLGHVGLFLGNELFELDDLSDFLERKDLILLIAVNGQTCRVLREFGQTRASGTSELGNVT